MKYPRYYYALRDYTARTRYSVLTLLQALLLVGWYYILHPLHTAVLHDARSAYERQRTAVEQAATLENDIAQLKKRKVTLTHELSVYMQMHLNATQIVQRLVDDMQQGGLTIQHIEQTQAESHEWFEIINIAVTAHGKLHALQAVLRTFKTYVIPLAIADMTMHMTSNNDVYAITMRCKLYILHDKKESPSTLKKAEGLGG